MLTFIININLFQQCCCCYSIGTSERIYKCDSQSC